MTRSRLLLVLAVGCLACGALASTASAAVRFRPRVLGALGLVPPVNDKGVSVSQDIASGTLTPVTYHGGSVMDPLVTNADGSVIHGLVTVHTIFWDGGNPDAFQGRPNPNDVLIPNYEGMIEQFFGDVAGDSGLTSNLFSVLPQYAEETGVNGATPCCEPMQRATRSTSRTRRRPATGMGIGRLRWTARRATTATRSTSTIPGSSLRSPNIR